jgi:hypothetical protein
MRAQRTHRLAMLCATLVGVALIGSAPAASAGPGRAAAGQAASSTSVTVTGGSTTTVSTPALGKALILAGIVPLPVGKAKLNSLDLKTLSLTVTQPIVGGTLDPAAFFAGHIDHAGGLQFFNVKTLRSVTVSDFVVYNDANPRLEATVNHNSNQKVTLFKVDLSGLVLTGGPGQLGLGNVGLSITEEGAALLNGKLRTKVFTAGTAFGSANTTVLYK